MSKESVLIHGAIVTGDETRVKKLIDSGIYIEEPGEFGMPLHTAVYSQKRKPSILKILLDAGANVNALNEHGEYPIHGTAMYSDCKPSILKILLDAGANPNALTRRDETCVFHLYGHPNSRCWEYNLTKLELLIKYGLDVNIKNVDGDTALHCAIIRFPDRHVLRAIGMLIEAGSNGNIKNKKGKTPRELICFRAKNNVSDILKMKLMFSEK